MLHHTPGTLHKTLLFEAQQGGYATYRIPAIVATAKGVVLAFCEARKSGRGDWCAIDILMRRSPDGGQTWEPPQKISRVQNVAKNPVALQQGLAGANEITFNNPAPIVDRQTGAIHFLHCAEYARCFYMRSDDEGLTWSEPVEITATFEAFRPEYDWKVIATGPGHGIQLRNGRLMVPIWMSTGTGGHAHRPSCVSVIYSDDHGQTWQRGEIVVDHSDETPNPSETVALELADGRVMLNIRSESKRNRRLIALSADGATGWSRPIFDEELFEPVCFASLIRLTQQPAQGQNRILFANPDSQHSDRPPLNWGAWPRENLTVKLSYDEGQTWPVSKVLDSGVAGYSDLAVGTEGLIYLFYEGGSAEGSMFHNTHMSVLRFDLAWLTDSQDSV